MIDLTALWKERTEHLDAINARRYKPSVWLPYQPAQALMTGLREVLHPDMVLRREGKKIYACTAVVDAYTAWMRKRMESDKPLAPSKSEKTAQVFGEPQLFEVTTPEQVEPEVEEVEIPENALAVTNVFEFEGHCVRFVGTAEKPEWVAADIIAVLYPESSKENRSNYLKKVPSDWKGIRDVLTPGGLQKMTTVFESGVYHFIARSNSPLATPFQRWLYEDVLPAIRKHGSYTTPSQPPQPAQPVHTLQDALSLADYVAATMSDCGVDPVFVACDRFNILASMLPNQAEALAAAKQNLLAGATTQDVAINPTAIGRMVSQKTERICSPVFINRMLIDIGWQERTHTANTDYIATELGRPHSVSRRVKTENYEGFHLHWFPKTTVPALVQFIQTGKRPSEGVAQ